MSVTPITTSAERTRACNTSKTKTHPIVALEHDILRPVPITTVLHRRLQIGAVVTVKVGEDAVLVSEPAIVLDGRSLLHGRERAGGRPLGAEGAAREGGEGGGGGSRRSGYHDGGLGQWRGEDQAVLWREGKGELTAIPALAERSAIT